MNIWGWRYVWDWSPYDTRTVSVKKVIRSGNKCLCIYIRGHYIHRYSQWREGRLGKLVAQYMEKRKFDGWLKCVFFDSAIGCTEAVNTLVRDTQMRSVIDFAYDIGDKENTLCFSQCPVCSHFCSVKFTYSATRMLKGDYKLCITCCDIYEI